MSGQDSRHRVAASLEEALRLAALPGEHTGRLYCFRSVAVTGLPARAARAEWMDRVQQTLSAEAAQAVHGADPRAAFANAVYFNNYEEALETLLRNALRAGPRAEWYSVSLLRLPPDSGPASRIAAVLECLRQPPISPWAAAGIILAAIGAADPAPLLDAIPPFAASAWLRGLEPRGNPPVDLFALELPAQIRTMLRQAAGHCGWTDPRTIWLAAMAVISVSPAASASGSAVSGAPSVLRRIASKQRQESADDFPSAPAAVARSARAVDFHDGPDASTQKGAREEGIAAAPEPSAAVVRGRPVEPSADAGRPRSEAPPAAVPPERHAGPTLLGAPTSAAGLYFLLNVMRRLGIASAIESCPALAEAGLAAHILKRLALHAGVERGDPILLCLNPGQPEFILFPEVLAALPAQPGIWPRDFQSPRAPLESGFLPRTWSLAVRRWCWRTGGITVREIVNRTGHVWLTRSDLDVTLPLAAADIRIRRIGLDIDPGWLPWLGEYGRAVRFHYRNPEPGGAPP
jgi:hypothetical protein